MPRPLGSFDPLGDKGIAHAGGAGRLLSLEYRRRLVGAVGKPVVANPIAPDRRRRDVNAIVARMLCAGGRLTRGR
jgi:hypothetical protein